MSEQFKKFKGISYYKNDSGYHSVLGVWIDTRNYIKLHSDTESGMKKLIRQARETEEHLTMQHFA